MKRSTSAFFSPRVLIALLLCAAGGSSIVSGTLLAFFYPEAPTKDAKRTLTFEERVSYQRAIEEVYWRHRIWPKDSPSSKPSLDSVISQSQLQKKVTDYLRKSQALEDYWQRPITAQQLQAEMERMATHTKQSEVLQDLFEALGNDPFVIAECLARPALAERLLTNWYANDQRIHGELKQLAETELQTHASLQQMKQLSGKYSEIEFVKSDGARNETNRNAEHSVKLNSGEWDEIFQKLAVTFNKSESQPSNGRDGSLSRPSRSARPAIAPYQTLPVGKLSSLQEDESRYYATAILSKTTDRIKLATVSWLKEPLQAWLTKAENQFSTAMAVPASNYTLPTILGGGCAEDTWTRTAGAPDPRAIHTAVWTGSEMIIWGGSGGGIFLNTGGRYNPSTDSWIATGTTDAPSARGAHTAVWTGSEMIIWGGVVGVFEVTNTGGRYNPITDSWIVTSTTNAPGGRGSAAAVWTGSEMIVWGGHIRNPDFSITYSNTGGRYNPSTDTWAATTLINAPEARDGRTAVWTGSEMIIWGAFNGAANLNTGGRYNPSTDTWAATTLTNAPEARDGHTAVWTGSEMIIWGGFNGAAFLNTGGRYNPVTNSWIATSTTNVPTGRSGHTAVWSGSQMIVWGATADKTGGRYNPGTNSWVATSTTNAPEPRDRHTAVWTDSEMIVWGGTPDTTGGRYNPNMDSWAPTATAPAPRYLHTAVWTGSEMIVWGGIFDSLESDSGGRYNLSTDTWAATSITNAPDARYDHTAVWTGREMIVWGGWENFVVLNTGGKYNPITDSWRVTTTANAPAARRIPTAVWTGSEMIVWGGQDENFDPLNTGGRYNPGRNSWAATSITNAPDARESHTAIWTGSDMIVWGGLFFDGVFHYFNTGGRYNPATDGWTPTSTISVPTARGAHTALWTGTEMIVWGGTVDTTGGRYNPATNSWIATSTINAPDARSLHTAVWTGAEMIIWGGNLNTGGRYDPKMDNWAATSIANAPEARQFHTAVWTGDEMIVWGGDNLDFHPFDSGGRYCAQGGPTPTPTPTPTPYTGRSTPTPRPHATPAPRHQ